MLHAPTPAQGFPETSKLLHSLPSREGVTGTDPISPATSSPLAPGGLATTLRKSPPREHSPEATDDRTKSGSVSSYCTNMFAVLTQYFQSFAKVTGHIDQAIFSQLALSLQVSMVLLHTEFQHLWTPLNTPLLCYSGTKHTIAHSKQASISVHTSSCTSTPYHTHFHQ